MVLHPQICLLGPVFGAFVCLGNISYCEWLFEFSDTLKGTQDFSTLWIFILNDFILFLMIFLSVWF